MVNGLIDWTIEWMVGWIAGSITTPQALIERGRDESIESV